MTKQYRTKHFILQELVHPKLYRDLGQRCWRYMDDRALRTLDALREFFGPAYCNTWHWWEMGKKVGGARFDSRGLRPFNDPDGATYSDHKFGDAFDLQFVRFSADHVRKYILGHPDEFPYITILEDDVNWLHFSVGNEDAILIIKP